jgi:ribonuclease HI
MLSNFFNSLLVFTDGSISTSSANFSFYIPTLNISFFGKINALTSSFTTECYAIINVLQFISRLEFNNFLIIFDSQSCLLAIASDSFNSSLSPLILIIKSLVYHLSLKNKIVNFFWIPSHLDITGNERVDHLAFSTKYTNHISFCKIPASDLLPIHRKILQKAWQTKLSSLPPNYGAWHRQIVPTITRRPWFNDLGLSVI